MTRDDAWPDNARQHEQPNPGQDDVQPAGVREDAVPEDDRRLRAYNNGYKFLYPVALIAGALFLMILAAV